MYDDGTFCQAVIAGEPVNPDFGVTKAGRPRKRLAKACTTCREKKIKCVKSSPGYAPKDVEHETDDVLQASQPFRNARHV